MTRHNYSSTFKHRERHNLEKSTLSYLVNLCVNQFDLGSLHVDLRVVMFEKW